MQAELSSIVAAVCVIVWLLSFAIQQASQVSRKTMFSFSEVEAMVLTHLSQKLSSLVSCREMKAQVNLAKRLVEKICDR